MKPKENEINIKSQASITVKTGDKLVYPYKLHGSVGFNSRYEISDEDVITISEERVKYLQPERMKDPHITGADNARGEFVFATLKPGKATITIYNEFRFEVESTEIIEVTVE